MESAAWAPTARVRPRARLDPRIRRSMQVPFGMKRLRGARVLNGVVRIRGPGWRALPRGGSNRFASGPGCLNPPRRGAGRRRTLHPSGARRPALGNRAPSNGAGAPADTNDVGPRWSSAQRTASASREPIRAGKLLHEAPNRSRVTGRVAPLGLSPRYFTAPEENQHDEQRRLLLRGRGLQVARPEDSRRETPTQCQPRIGSARGPRAPPGGAGGASGGASAASGLSPPRDNPTGPRRP